MAIHRSAFVDPAAHIDPSAEIGPHVVIDGPVTIGRDCRLGPSAVVMGDTKIGAGTVIHSHAVIGDVPQDFRHNGDNSGCVIGNRCTIREGVTVHRATRDGESTIVGDGCYLMTNSHVAHDCVLAEQVTLVSGALLGGHVHVGRKAIIGGNTGVHQNVRIGEMAMVGAVAMICQDIPPYMLTNHEGEIVGLNAIGMMRAGIVPKERQTLKAIFKLIYRSGLPLQQAIEMADELATGPEARVLVEFFAAESRRGLRRFTNQSARAA